MMTNRDRIPVKPYRAYRQFDGRLEIIADSRISRCPTIDITESQVAALLDSHGLKCPKDTKALVLEALVLINSTVPMEYAFPAGFVQTYNRVVDAVDVLAAELPPVVDAIRMKTQLDGFVIGALKELGIAVGKSRPLLEKFRHRHPSAWWHDDAEYLRWCLRSARTRAGTSPSFSKPNAPAIRCIRSAFELARLWHPKSERVWAPSTAAIAEALTKKQASET